MSFLDICKDSDLSKYSPEFAEWERVAQNLPEFIETGTLRRVVSEELPVLNLTEIKNDLGAVQRMYTVVTFIAHGYIRGSSNNDTLTRLPWKIASVWLDLSNWLGIPPVATYSATVLFNLKQSGGDLMKVDDIEILFTFTGTEDEKWFYVISAAVDIESGDVLRIAMEMLLNANLRNLNVLGTELCSKIRSITEILNRMYERCRPEVFYNRVRRYLAGWFKDPHLQEAQGLVYELSSKGDSITMNLAGGSAAQNPTIQLLDVLLGVKHDQLLGDASDLTLKEYSGTGCVIDYLCAMRTYMPPEHANFLNGLERDLTSTGVLAEFKKTSSYAECLRTLSDFRSEHIKMVSRYIICQSSRCDVKGTGGSNPIQFLKKCRWDTETAAISINK